MKNNLINQKFKADVKKCLNSKLETIKASNSSKRIKIKMLEGLLTILREQQQAERGKIRENISTSFSEQQSNFTAYEEDIEELEEKILEKRVIKFQINEEIEGVEEDLFQIQKTVDTKRDYDEHLRKLIEKKMSQVEKTPPAKQKQADKSYLNKSIGAVSGIFKGWLY